MKRWMWTAGAVALTACGSHAGSDNRAGVAKSNATTAYEALKGPEWVRCWVTPDTSTTDTFFQAHKLSCRYAQDATSPIKLTFVSVETSDARSATASAILSDARGTDIVVNPSVRNESFPLTVTALVVLDDTSTAALAGGLGITPRVSVIEAHLSIATLASASVDSPVVFRQPFDLWPLGIVDALGNYAFRADPVEMSLAPFVVGQSVDAKPDVVLRTELSSTGEPRRDLFVVAPPAGVINGTYTLATGAAMQTSIPGPGLYRATASGFAKIEDDSADGGAAIDPRDDGGAETGIPTADASARDALLSNGGDCGSASQAACIDPSGNRTCNAGARYEATTELCLACGNPDQTYCVGPSGNRTCNTGARYETTTESCLACGNPGQTYCVDPSGNRTCNAGARYEATTESCLACGNLSQTYCVDLSGNRTCSPPNHYDSSTETCQP